MTEALVAASACGSKTLRPNGPSGSVAVVKTYGSTRIVVSARK